ncbi:heat shock protein HspQ [Stratiformator vulcanicus]|uniref:Heat shock protein HspQ n=1 Tax=Stratiformator vulcanicus TaxID=2527980 RepID=A0A517R4G6_9PLAN|nr:heat shock protein HspQ [Stratiformator vulcanicus]QDT38761.1 Heat shock protein HspQ [Stratiformator vulcanicus]
MISVNTNFLVDPLPDRVPIFAVGHIVRHRRYGYRGVIVSVDGHCKADPAWYFANVTQPARDQPWYHVLVDGTSECTYPAEENLEMDDAGDPLAHPLIATYFDGFEYGRYHRNEEPWPGF